MTYGEPSGTNLFDPLASDIFLEAFELAGIRFPNGRQMQSVNRSANLLLASKWSNRGINLWKVDRTPTQIDLMAGVATYSLDADVIGITAMFRRQPTSVSLSSAAPASIIPYLVGDPVSSAVTLTTTVGSAVVNVEETAHGRSAGEQISIIYPVSVGGLVIGGVYQVITVVDANNYTLNVTFAAESTQSASVIGEGGQDIGMSPISRHDYAMLPNKLASGPPTTYFFNRQISPEITVWPVPPTSPALTGHAYLFRQINDVQGSNGQTLDVPVRMLRSFSLDLAVDMSMKWNPDKYQLLKPEAEAAWMEAAEEDTENVPINMIPNLPTGLG